MFENSYTSHDNTLAKLADTKKKNLRYFKANESIEKDAFKGNVIKVVNTEKKFRHRKHSFKNLKRKNLPQLQIDSKILEKHTRGESAKTEGVKTRFFKTKLKKKEICLNYAVEQAARTEILLTEENGFLEAEEEEQTFLYKQEEISKNVDITAASKFFKLNLNFGPYHHRYTKNGRHLLIGGRRGHVAAFDWVTKKLHCEINVMEEIADISWLHVETMFACAQKNWTYFYDKKGTELHCVKTLHSINKLEFLPYHFLLATASSTGFLSWLDITIGEIIGQYNSKLGDIRLMCQNPINGVICIGSGKGVVSMWTPKIKEPVAKILCHGAPMTALTVDPKGNYLVTAGLDKKVKIWDARNLGTPLEFYSLRMPANNLTVSQKGMLSFSMGNFCEIYKNIILADSNEPYLRQKTDSYIHDLRFSPFEDILGISHAKGFLSMLVPGSGEANFDSYEANPYQTASQRRENEVHSILEKIPPELITLDPNDISGVDVAKLEERINTKKQIFFIKPPQIDFTSRRKMKGKGGSAKAARNKQIVKNLRRKEFIAGLCAKKNEILSEHGVKISESTPDKDMKNTFVLDRFKNKKLVK
ncbi:WD repeat-containing protein 46 [Condylostylus longicornis]|uniref:WD repeat-containing protein 46 n=1 Tax=Condylostylus longicornis TaxID=2530218 RepID=UPI00244DEEB4|nr:WD repeat-containing protein 46 [Condylostylus longicornis]